MSRKSVAIMNAAAAALLVAGASVANASEQSNPLHPAYFNGKVAITDSIAHPHSYPYVDSRNPLHPAFAQGGDVAWRGAATTPEVSYVDMRNPLHPAFAR